MARSSKTRTDKTPVSGAPSPEAEILDAEVIAETAPVAAATEDAPRAEDEDTRVAVDAETGAEPIAEAAVASETPETVEPEPEPVVSQESAPEPNAVEPEPAPAYVPPPSPPPAAPTQVVRRTGFVPVMLGGAIVAVLGFAAGWQGLIPSPRDTALDAQGARIDAVEAAVAALPPPPDAVDLSPLQAEIAALRDGIAPLADRIAALETRIDTLERAPANDGTLSATAIAAWQQDIEDLKAAVAAQDGQVSSMAEAVASRDAALAALQDDMAAQQADMARMVDEAAQRLDAAQSTVAGIEQEATATATATLRRAVLASLQTAVDAGQPFANLLGELEGTGVAVPDGLAGPAADGVPTLAMLTDGFPDAARAALASARAEGLADDGGGGVMAFLRSQLDVRSVEPREGDDPDAILSRAEAALREARLGDALAEIGTLPEVVRAPMTDWIAAAETRVGALSALQTLAETLPAPDMSN